MFRQTVAGYIPSPDAIAVALGGLARFVSRVERGQRLGQITSYQPNDAQNIAAGLWATCHGYVSLELDGIANEYVDWGAIFEIGMRIAIAGFHPSVAPHPG